MSESKKAPRTPRSRRDVHQEVTDRIVEALERGVAPWVRPWSADLGRSRNGNSQRPYHGVNAMLLALEEVHRGYGSREWFTYRGARRAGGHVRKGEHGTLIVFWRQVKKEEEDPATGETVVRMFPVAGAHFVFNRDQCDGLKDAEALEPRAEAERHELAEKVIASSGADVRHGGGRAFYRRSEDRVQLPPPESFKTQGDYYSTAFHELVHWTGGPERLDREKGKQFGDDAYAFEELVAELGAAYLCAEVGIDGALQHAEYLACWAEALKDDKRAIFRAASHATKAARYLAEKAGLEEEAGRPFVPAAV